MINETNILNDFLKDSPYTDGEKKELTLYIDGLDLNKIDSEDFN